MMIMMRDFQLQYKSVQNKEQNLAEKVWVDWRGFFLHDSGTL